MLGHALTEDEQDILDAGEPKDMDAKSFFTMINQCTTGATSCCFAFATADGAACRPL